MTQMAVENLSQHAMRRASNAHLFDVAYIEDIFRRLQNADIASGRLSQITQLLREVLKGPLEQWGDCIDRFGSMGHPAPMPSGSSIYTRRSTPTCPEPTPSSSRLLYVDVSQTPSPLDVQSTRERSSSSPSDTESAPSDSDSDSAQTEWDAQSSSMPKKSLAISRKSLTTAARGERAVNNMQLYGTICPKAPFDVFARAIIAAWAATPHVDDSPSKIREHARPPWRNHISWEQKDDWYKIYETRHDPATDVTVMGCTLLLSQGLLTQLVPADRTSAARRLCQNFEKQLRSSEAELTQSVTTPKSSRIAQRQRREVTDAPID